MIKKYLLSFVILFSSFQGCNDSLNDPISNSTLKYLNVKIPDYNLSGDVILKIELDWKFSPLGVVDSVIVFGSAPIRSDGFVSLKLNTPPGVFLKPRNGLGCIGLQFNNDEVKTYPNFNYRLYKNDKLIGSLYCASKPNAVLDTVGDYFSYLIYADDDLFVSGDCSGQSGNRITTFEHNLLLERGWNIVINRLTEITDSTFVQESFVNNYFRGNWILYVQN